MIAINYCTEGEGSALSVLLFVSYKDRFFLKASIMIFYQECIMNMKSLKKELSILDLML